MSSRVGGIEKQSYSDHWSISIIFKLAKLTFLPDYVCAVPVCECGYGFIYFANIVIVITMSVLFSFHVLHVVL